MSLPPFQNFIDRYSEDVYRFLLVAVGPADVDDCYQETFLSAMRAYPRLRPDSNLKGWVLTIANRKALDSHRARGRRRTVPGEVPEMPVEMRSNGFDPQLWEAVRGLPPKQRDAVLHRFVNDLPYAGIAGVMGGTQEAARRNVHEGLKKLREGWSQ